MKIYSHRFLKLMLILIAGVMLFLTSCSGTKMGMSYGVSGAKGTGGTAVQPHFNAGVYAGGRVW